MGLFVSRKGWGGGAGSGSRPRHAKSAACLYQHVFRIRVRTVPKFAWFAHLTAMCLVVGFPVMSQHPAIKSKTSPFALVAAIGGFAGHSWQTYRQTKGVGICPGMNRAIEFAGRKPEVK